MARSVTPFPIPVVVLGPGSQPEEEALQYIASPGEMAVFQRPTLRRQSEPEATAGAQTLLDTLIAAMERDGFSEQTTRVPLSGLDPELLAELNELLASGEVSVRITTPEELQIQETAFAGVWRVQACDGNGQIVRDDIEAGPIPKPVRDALAGVPARSSPPKTPPEGVMNAPSIVREILDVAANYRAGDPAHVVNLTLLPVSPADVGYLASELGGGPVTILSRGYGNCRVSSTAVPHTWWVQYFNSTDKLILNTIEVVDVPVVALAAAEDFADSIERLREWRATL